jgi:rhomboid protease GluP
VGIESRNDAAHASQPAQSTFGLVGRPNAIRLDETGLHHPRTPRGGGFAYTRYEHINHLSTSSRALWIGTRTSVYIVARRAFEDHNGPEHLVRVLLARIAHCPGGAAQLARMAEIEETARTTGSLRATWGLGIACIVVFLLQLVLGDNIHAVGYFSAPLVADGDWWRLLTANLLHAFPVFPLHLVLNLLGLAAIGSLVERSVGTARTLCVMGASALGSMGASGLHSDIPVVGVSGVVFGLLGALLWLEFMCADRLPAWWRIPRHALLTVLVVSAALGFFVPMIAGAAHLGGLVAGGLAMMLVGGRGVGARPNPVWLRAAATATLAVTAAAVVTAGAELYGPGDYTARQIARLAHLENISPGLLNDFAWSIAIDPEAKREHLEAALLLAERAVAETERGEAAMLDTLAELQFQLGQPELALQTIDEAIAREPDETYYREQRRRFTGERDPDDRPDAPGFELPWHESPPPPEEPGITV